MNLSLLHGHLCSVGCYVVRLTQLWCGSYKAAVPRTDALKKLLGIAELRLILLCRTHRLGLRHMGMILLIMCTPTVCFWAKMLVATGFQCVSCVIGTVSKGKMFILKRTYLRSMILRILQRTSSHISRLSSCTKKVPRYCTTLLWIVCSSN